MINHARTLILNLKSPNPADPPAANEEFIEPTFQPRAYPTALSSIRVAMVPGGLSRSDANLRANWLMQLLHAPDLEPYVLGIDPRFTYLLDDQPAAAAFIAAVPPTQQSAIDLYNQLTARVTANIFSAGGRYADELAALERIWLNGRDLGVRVGAAALAFVYQASLS